MNVTNRKLGIAIPLTWSLVHSSYHKSFIAMEKPDYTLYDPQYEGPIDEIRNSLVHQALGDGCSHLALLDTDQVYHPQTIMRLLSHKLPVVGCLIFRRYQPFDPLMLRGEPGKYQIIEQWEPNSLVEVDATGCGCLLFDTQIFRRMPEPWFRFREHNGRTVGEDIGFCADLRKAGYRIFVDTSVPADHLTTIRVNEMTWRLYRRLKQAAAGNGNGGSASGNAAP